MNDLLTWAGWWEYDFFSHPLGLFISFILFTTASMRVLRPRPRDHWADTLFFSATALIYLIVFAAGVSNRVPHYAVKTILCFMAVRAIWRGIEDWKRGEI